MKPLLRRLLAAPASAPGAQAVAEPDVQRRHDEHLFEADVGDVHAVIDPSERRRENVPGETRPSIRDLTCDFRGEPRG